MSLFEVYTLFNVHPVKAENVFIYDDKGNKYLDLYGGHAVISIGHSHPKYVRELSQQLSKIGFYSNSVENKLQINLAKKLGKLSQCEDYKLFLCNSGAEANENALKLASFHTGKSKIVAFKNGFHGRTSAAVSASDNAKIIAPLNAKHEVVSLAFGDKEGFSKALEGEDICAVIIETIQGVGGLDQVGQDFFYHIENKCNKHDVILIADEVQSGFGRTGKFFAFQHFGIKPHIISMAKGMGNGFPVGGILIHSKIKASPGLLGTTFGGNHLACVASRTVLEVLKEENLMRNAMDIENYFKNRVNSLEKPCKVKGRGLMLGLEFNFPIIELRKKLLYKHHIFTGSSNDPNVLRLLPPLTIKKKHIDLFISAIYEEL